MEVNTFMIIKENVDTQRGIEMIVDACIKYASTHLIDRIKKIMSVDNWKEYIITPESIGDIRFNEVFKKIPAAPEKIMNFIRDMKSDSLTIRFVDQAHTGNLGEYIIDHGMPQISISIDQAKLDFILEYIQSGKITEAIMFHFLRTFRKILVHEMVHAYDEWISKGKHQQNYRSKLNVFTDTDHYMNDPIEINARYAEVVSELNKKLEFNDYKTLFIQNIGKWEIIPKNEQRRLIQRLYSEWYQDRKKLPNVKNALEHLKQRMKNTGLDIIISYSQNSGIVIEKIYSDKGDVIFKALKTISVFADLYNVVISLPFWEPEALVLGFRSQNGRHFNHALPHSTQMWRKPQKITS